MPIVILEGQQIPLSTSQAANDETIINTLLPFYADVAGATLTRKIVNGEEQIEIVKKVGTKGNLDLVLSLLAAPEFINPALSLSWQLKALEIQGQLTLETLIAVSGEIDAAIAQGEKETAATGEAIATLANSLPIPSCYPITGL
jgi:hypothetical protein